MSLKKCVCISAKSDQLKYTELKDIIKEYTSIVQDIKKEEVIKREKGHSWKEDKVTDQSYILISHYAKSSAEYKVLVKDADQYNLVVNFSKLSCYPVNKKFFTQGLYLYGASLPKEPVNAHNTVVANKVKKK